MRKNKDPHFYPILIDLGKFPCLVVGGGEVALRKVLSLLEFKADITVISWHFCKSLTNLAAEKKIKIIKNPYTKEYLSNFKIVFCATDNAEVNQIVHHDCSERGILINVADFPSLCDFILPATVKRGNLTVSVSSQGKAPFFTKEIKHKIESFISPVYEDVLDLAGEFREHVLKDKDVKTNQRKAKLFGCFNEINWEKSLSEKGKKKSRKQLLNILNDVK